MSPQSVAEPAPLNSGCEWREGEARAPARRLVVDARWLRTGIGSYLLNVLEGGRRHRNGTAVEAIVRPGDVRRVASFCDEIRIVDLPIYTLREQIEIPRAARGADLLHVPHYNIPLAFRGKLLVTLHDLIHIMDPAVQRSLPARLYARPMLRLAARRARHIITVSEYSKNQIIEHLHVSPRKVTVIYNGVHPRFRPVRRSEALAKAAAVIPARGPFILYVGNLKPHKNIGCLLQAFALWRSHGGSDHQLVIVGDESKWKKSLIETCVRLRIQEGVIFVSHVSHDLLPNLYAAADLLVLPSYLEGFGLPAIEAMACGTPVVCSRAASLPEVAGDAAEFFEPSSAEDLAAAIRRVLESPERGAGLRRKGLARASRFSWDECGRLHWRLYRELMED